MEMRENNEKKTYGQFLLRSSSIRSHCGNVHAAAAAAAAVGYLNPEEKEREMTGNVGSGPLL